MGFLHESCLEEEYLSRQDLDELTCSVCKHAMDGPLAVRLGELGLRLVVAKHCRKRGQLRWSAKALNMLISLANALESDGLDLSEYPLLSTAKTRRRDLLLLALAIAIRAGGPDYWANVAQVLSDLGAAYTRLGTNLASTRHFRKKSRKRRIPETSHPGYEVSGIRAQAVQPYQYSLSECQMTMVPVWLRVDTGLGILCALPFTPVPWKRRIPETSYPG